MVAPLVVGESAERHVLRPRPPERGMSATPTHRRSAGRHSASVAARSGTVIRSVHATHVADLIASVTSELGRLGRLGRSGRVKRSPAWATGDAVLAPTRRPF